MNKARVLTGIPDDVQAALDAASKADVGKRVPLNVQLSGILASVEPVAEEVDEVTGAVSKAAHLLLTFDVKYGKNAYTLTRKFYYLNPEAVEKFHDGVDRASDSQTRHKDWKGQLEWLMNNVFPCYATLFYGKACIQFGEAPNHK